MARCRSCGAEIVFITTTRGKKMPCEAEPVWFDEMVGGPDTVVTRNGEVIRATIHEGGAEEGYVSHFANCPGADLHRRGQR